MGITAEFHSAGLDGDRLLFEVETTLYRIAQEALNNVSKHSQASRVDVILERREGCAVLVIEDNGVGFDLEQEGILTAPGKELGIIGMRERAALVGGAFEIESSPGDGTTVFVRIPLSQANQ